MELRPEDGFEKKVFRKSQSIATVRFYRSGRRKFGQFCKYECSEDIPHVAEHIKVGELDVYDLLDHYVDWLEDQGLRPKTVVGYAQGAKKLLRYHDVLVMNELFLEKVTLPTVEEILDEAPTPDQLRLILARSSLRMKALLLVLATSGMRLGEVIMLRLDDFDFASKPVRVVIPAAYTKNSRERETYITDEAMVAVQAWLESWRAKSLGDDSTLKSPRPADRMFRFEGDVHMAGKGATHAFRRVMVHFPELDKRASEGHRVHKIHFHSFRKFFFSRAMPIIGEERTHALMGHSFYMKTYYRRSKEDRMADYLKCTDALSVANPITTLTREDVEKKGTLRFYWLSIESSPVGRSPMELLDQAEKRSGKPLTVDEQIALLKDAYLDMREQETDLMEQGKERLIPEEKESVSNKVIPESALEECLSEGWQFVSQLSDGRIVVRR